MFFWIFQSLPHELWAFPLSRWEHKALPGFLWSLCTAPFGWFYPQPEFPHTQKTHWKHRWTGEDSIHNALYSLGCGCENLIILDRLWLQLCVLNSGRWLGLTGSLSLHRSLEHLKAGGWRDCGRYCFLLSGTTALPCPENQCLEIVLNLYNIS